MLLIPHRIRLICLQSLLALLVLSATAVCKRDQAEITRPPEMIDLSSFDFTKEVKELNGPWEFYWQKFLLPGDFGTPHSVPDGYAYGLRPWSTIETEGKKPGAEGYATYRLRFRLPENPPRMGIRISFQNSSFRLFVNGQEAALSGKPGTSEKNTLPSRAGRVVYFQPDTSELEIILHVANYYVFRGGLRGFIQLGSAENIEASRNRGLVMDLIVAGFGISIWVYHLFLFLQRPQDRSILFFLLLSGSFIPRYFVLSERTLYLLIPEIPFDVEIRMIHFLHVLTPALLLLFMRSIFPESIPSRIVRFFFLSTLVYFGTWFLSSQIYTKTFIVYSICATIGALVPIGFALFKAMRNNARGALFQSLGILLFVIFIVFAFMGVIVNDPSGMSALLAFTSLSFFQALSLSASYSEKMQTNLFMARQLRESREALAQQRKELELNLHDALGGSLTDLKIFTERMRTEIPRDSWPDAIDTLDRRISDMIRTLRTQLLFMEDMELASSEPFTGVHMALLRRYTDAGRELIFVTSVAGPSKNVSDQTNTWLHLFFLLMEMCTNDLKYGVGESKWTITRDGSTLLVRQENRMAERKDGTISTPGRRVAERTELLGGVIKAATKGDFFETEIHFPKFWK